MAEILDAPIPPHLLIRHDEAKAQYGDDAIALSVADMDLATSPAIFEAITSRAAQGTFGYTYLPDSYFATVQNWLHTQYTWQVPTSAITYVPRVIEGVSIALAEFTKPGDGVLVHTPAYGPITNQIEPLGRRLVTSPLQLVDGRYEFDFEDTERLLAGEAKVLVLCSPHNPTGRVWTEAELTKLAEIASRHGTLIISDEVHADLVHPGGAHTPIASLTPDAAQRTLTMTSPAKPFNLAGLEVSNVIIENDDMREHFKEALHRQGFHNPTYFAAVALEAAYRHSSDWLNALRDHVVTNLATLRSYVNTELPGVQVIEPEGTYLAWLDCRGWTSDEAELLQWMQRARVALSPGTAFGADYQGFVRLNLAVSTNTLRTALDRLGDSRTHHSKENGL